MINELIIELINLAACVLNLFPTNVNRNCKRNEIMLYLKRLKYIKNNIFFNVRKAFLQLSVWNKIVVILVNNENFKPFPQNYEKREIS